MPKEYDNGRFVDEAADAFMFEPFNWLRPAMPQSFHVHPRDAQGAQTRPQGVKLQVARSDRPSATLHLLRGGETCRSELG